MKPNIYVIDFFGKGEPTEKHYSETPKKDAQIIANGYCNTGEKTRTKKLNAKRPNGYIIEGPTDYDVVYFL